MLELASLGYIKLAKVLADSVEVKGDAVIQIDADNSITLTGVNMTDLHSDDFIFL